MSIKVDFNNMLSNFIGEQNGIDEKQIDAMQGFAADIFDKVISNKGKDMMGWCNLPYNQNEVVEDMLKTAKEVRENFDNFVVLGIGGSALGPMAVFKALCHLKHNELSKEKRNAPKFYVEDNIDPERMTALLDVIDVKKTVFNVISKSGATSETMSQYLIIVDILKKAVGKDFAKHIIATTDEKKGNLIKLAKEFGFKTFTIPDGVGGRFSELCPVGLFPASVLGIDVKQMLKGASEMDKRCSDKDLYKNPALLSAIFQYISTKRGKNISVMMPYADSLKLIADWYCQLWGESLGKTINFGGEVQYVGQTPVKALGVTDQHSQVQLYVDGPFDKVVTFIAVEEFRTTVEIPSQQSEIKDVTFLCGHTLNELINTERKATEYALQSAGRCNYTIILSKIDAHSIGELLWLFQMQTAFCGEMLKVSTYDQPGVENGKDATYALFNRAGYEEKRKELLAVPKKISKFIV